jgi:Ca-activated chloride channel family protein
MNFNFQYHNYFLLLILLVFFIILFVMVQLWKKNTIRKIGDVKLVKQLINNYSPFLFTTRFIVFLMAFAAGIFAAANLRKPGATDSTIRKGIDVVIALDVSNSMLAVDIQPNRLERAKQMISGLMDQMPDDRIGLVLFAGRAYLQMPLTVDHGAAKLFVSTASPGSIPSQGTVISEALKISTLAFNSKDMRFKSIVLISDGEDHDPEAMTQAELLAEQGVMINTVGIGSPEGSPIVDPVTGADKKDAMGNTVISKLNEDELKQIAEKTNGTYVRLQNSEEAINSLLTHFSQIERKAFGDVALIGYKTYYLWFAGPMFLLLIAEILIPERKKKISEK